MDWLIISGFVVLLLLVIDAHLKMYIQKKVYDLKLFHIQSVVIAHHQILEKRIDPNFIEGKE